MVIIITIML